VVVLLATFRFQQILHPSLQRASSSIAAIHRSAAASYRCVEPDLRSALLRRNALLFRRLFDRPLDCSYSVFRMRPTGAALSANQESWPASSFTFRSPPLCFGPAIESSAACIGRGLCMRSLVGHVHLSQGKVSVIFHRKTILFIKCQGVSDKHCANFCEKLSNKRLAPSRKRTKWLTRGSQNARRRRSRWADGDALPRSSHSTSRRRQPQPAWRCKRCNPRKDRLQVAVRHDARVWERVSGDPMGFGWQDLRHVTDCL
jgi:hypothetical protein